MRGVPQPGVTRSRSRLRSPSALPHASYLHIDQPSVPVPVPSLAPCLPCALPRSHSFRCPSPSSSAEFSYEKTSASRKNLGTHKFFIQNLW
ncbi:hypothetical protein KC19_5G003800 [Ceratodon purpureus]|uniref:Uncharacterized protein n=1 Tax=Ceratodon purpureus TaxID=3225 RepID=A0A8T0HXQ5_CERPU|nr:hypothetical protein KC19_5G003800 [Ceratodon purpureus]